METKYKPKIVSVTYLYKLNEELIHKIVKKDINGKGEPLYYKLEDIEGVMQVNYEPGKDYIRIKLAINNVKLIDPANNHGLWQTVTRIIGEHIANCHHKKEGESE